MWSFWISTCYSVLLLILLANFGYHWKILLWLWGGWVWIIQYYLKELGWINSLLGVSEFHWATSAQGLCGVIFFVNLVYSCSNKTCVCSLFDIWIKHGIDFEIRCFFFLGCDLGLTVTGKRLKILWVQRQWFRFEHIKLPLWVHFLIDFFPFRRQSLFLSNSFLQIRSHAQKYFLKVQKNGTTAHVPPPRPKRKAAHPYPQKASKNGVAIFRITTLVPLNI